MQETLNNKEKRWDWSEVEKKAEPSLPCVLFLVLENGDDVLQGEE